jgi:protein-S-isoprenylcysteine O-methyltransferase
MLWGTSELLLTAFKRSKAGSVSKDRYTLQLIWLVNLSAIAVAIVAAYRLHSCRMPWPTLALKGGFVLFGLGLILRWYSIIYLGRFFTTNVAIAKDHVLIDSGPYRFIRHPSYTGVLVMVIGFALSFANWCSLLIVIIPIFAMQLRRIHVEEQALLDGLGEQYRRYVRRTKRLVPMIY